MKVIVLVMCVRDGDGVRARSQQVEFNSPLSEHNSQIHTACGFVLVFGVFFVVPINTTTSEQRTRTLDTIHNLCSFEIRSVVGAQVDGASLLL